MPATKHPLKRPSSGTSTSFEPIVANLVVITDRAGFTREYLAAYQRQGLRWVMSVPASVGQARRCLEEVDPEELRSLAEGYRYKTFSTTYAIEVEQRWLVIYSEAAQKRAAKQMDKQLLKQGEKERKAFDEMCREAFHCPGDAWQALTALREKLGVLEVREADVIAQKHCQNAGRPATDAVPKSVSYHLHSALTAPIAVHQRRLIRRSCFILATNKLEEEARRPGGAASLQGPEQQSRMRVSLSQGPMFLASTLYLKRVERVMALLMVMTVCLLVYAALEHRIRQTLAEHDESVPDQMGRPTRRPTAK
jgi:transposase